MRLNVLAVGAMGGSEAELIRHYASAIKQAAKQMGFDAPHLIELKPHQDLASAVGKIKDAICVVLDERGEEMSSRDFAKALMGWRESAKQNLVFVIGGADGVGDELRARGVLLSLSKMTLPHMLARVVLYEQIWRAFSILTNHPYHRD